MAVLARKMVKKKNVAVIYGLIQWTNGTQDNATWKNLEELYAKFPDFDSHSWGQEWFEEGGLLGVIVNKLLIENKLELVKPMAHEVQVC